MRFESKILYNGDTKTKKKFLWFPVTIYVNGKKETRWLERATILYTYRMSYSYYGWTATQFLD